MYLKIISRIASYVILLSAIYGLLSCTQRTSTYQPEAFKFHGGAGPVYPWGSWVTDGPVNAITRSSSTIYFGGSFSSVHANTGGGAVVDATGGMIVPKGHVPYVDGAVNAVAPDGKGGWYIGGVFSRVGNKPKMNIAHIRADGSVDNWNPIAYGDVMTIAVSGNIVYAGGSFNDGGVVGAITIGGRSRNYIAALDASTGVATDWNPNPNADVWTIAVSGNYVYVGGDFNDGGVAGAITIGGDSRNYIAALNKADGSAVATWNPNANGPVFTIIVSGDSVYAGGSFNLSLGTPTIGGQGRDYIAELDAAGSPGATGAATAWDPNPNGPVLSMAMSAAGLAVSGAFSTFTDTTAVPMILYARQYIAILDRLTGLPVSWTITPDDWVITVNVSGDNLYIGGVFTNIITGVSNYTRNHVASFNLSTGNITGWDPNADGSVFALYSVPDKVYVGGSYFGINRHLRNNLAAVDASTGLLSPWDPDADNTVRALAADGDIIYAGGDFTLFTGVTDRYYLAALDAVTGVPTAWNPGCDGPVYSLAVNNSTVYAGGTFGQVTEADPSGLPVARTNIAAIYKDTGFVLPSPIGLGWNLGTDGPVNSLLLDGGLLYVGGSFGSLGGSPRNYAGAVNASTGDLVSWNPDMGGVVRTMALSRGTLYLGGDFTTVSGVARQYLAAVDADTWMVSGWNPQPDGVVYAMKVSGDRLFVGGDFINMGVAPPPPVMPPLDRIAIFELPSGTLSYYRSHIDNTVYALGAYGGVMYVGGSFGGINGSPMPYISAISMMTGQPVGYFW